VSQTDGQNSLSIGALEFDPTDASHQTLAAGVGRFSSLGEGGALTGVLRTTNGGTDWTSINGGGLLNGLNISGIAPRGAIIVVSVNAAENANFAARGIWRTTDSGTTWTQISGAPGSGLPGGASYDLTGDQTNRDRLYTNGGTTGLYRSADRGATWTKISGAAMDSLIAAASNIKIAVGTNNNLFVAIVDLSKGHVYVMNPGGGIDKLDIKDGKRLWNSKAEGAAKPLAVAGDRLITQAATPGLANGLKIVAPDEDGNVARDPATGKSLVGVRSLPPGVRPSLAETAQRRFVASARPAGQFAVISWEYSERPRSRGLPPDVEQKLQPRPAGGPAAAVPRAMVAPPTRHAFRMSLTDGSISDEPPAAPPPRATPGAPLRGRPLHPSSFGTRIPPRKVARRSATGPSEKPAEGGRHCNILGRQPTPFKVKSF
jgi:hypothetical protein